MIITLKGADFSGSNINVPSGGDSTDLSSATLLENTLINTSGITETNNSFFTYKDISVNENDILIIPYARNVLFFDKNENCLGYVNLTNSNASEGFAEYVLYPYVVKIPANASYMAYCAKYEELASEEAAINYPNSDGSYTVDDTLTNKGQLISVPYWRQTYVDTTFQTKTYFTICQIPVIVGRTYYSEYCRNYSFHSADGTCVSYDNMFNNNHEAVAPEGAVYMHATFKYNEVSKENASVVAK